MWFLVWGTPIIYHKKEDNLSFVNLCITREFLIYDLFITYSTQKETLQNKPSKMVSIFIIFDISCCGNPRISIHRRTSQPGDNKSIE